MREILFRGKKIESGEWIEGYYGIKGKETDLEKHYIVQSTFDSYPNHYPFYFTDIQVAPQTVGQYIGLKDKNGTKIFEGDILTSFSQLDQPRGCLKHTIVGKVIIEKGMVKIIGEIKEEYDDEMTIQNYKTLTLKSERFRKIGNIYDNPELLEVERNEIVGGKSDEKRRN